MTSRQRVVLPRHMHNEQKEIRRNKSIVKAMPPLYPPARPCGCSYCCCCLLLWQVKAVCLAVVTSTPPPTSTLQDVWAVVNFLAPDVFDGDTT